MGAGASTPNDTGHTLLFPTVKDDDIITEERAMELTDKSFSEVDYDSIQPKVRTNAPSIPIYPANYPLISSLYPPIPPQILETPPRRPLR